jgi:hypothetical protein
MFVALFPAGATTGATTGGTNVLVMVHVLESPATSAMLPVELQSQE